MTKPRDILKGKVKRLLREQEDMGMLCDPAVQHCVSALEAFVHDMGRRMKAQAEASGVAIITPIELKRSVLESNDLAFLHDKVQGIDESDAKYHKTTRKRKAAPAAQASTTKTAKASPLVAAGAAGAAAKTAAASKAKAASQGAAARGPTAASKPAAAVIEEDDNYDSSDSE